MSNVYREHGYSDREDYLSCIAEKIALKPHWYRPNGKPLI